MTIREKAAEVIKGNKTEKMTINELLASSDARVLIPKIIQAELKEGAEPLYLLTNLLQRIDIEEGKLIEVPIIGPLKAGEIAEGGPYPGETPDIAVERLAFDVKVKKIGLMVRVTQEIIDNSQWDILGMIIRAAGRALARYKEQLISNEFSLYGRTVFNNEVVGGQRVNGTTGRDKVGKFNNTLSYEDFFDMVVAIVMNEFIPTDVIMHPLMWVAYAKTGLFGGLQAQGMNLTTVASLQNPQNIIQPQIPFAMNVILNPFIPLDKETKTTDMYVIDRDEVGVLLVKEEPKTDDFVDPYRDIRAIKAREYYNVGILNEGRAIAVAKKLSVAPTYPFDYNISLQVDDDRITKGI